MKKKNKLVIEILIAIALTILIFCLTNWYNTLPIKEMLIRTIIMTLIIFDLIKLFSFKKHKNKIKRKSSK